MSSSSSTVTPSSAPAGASGSVHAPATTAWDVVERLVDYLGSDASAQPYAECVRALLAAYRELATVRRWTYYYTRGRVQCVAPYATGTVAYLHSAGAYARQLTLTGGTWPDWAVYGTVRVGSVLYAVSSRVSAAVLQLDPVLNPGPQGDTLIPAGSAYTLFRDSYTLPADFGSADAAQAEASGAGMEYVHPGDWARITRYTSGGGNNPVLYTFRGDPRAPGRLALSLWPQPDSAFTVDFLYHRTPRPIQTIQYTAGTASVGYLAAPATVTGSVAVWTSAMVGSVLRLYADGTQWPTDLAGSYPYAAERYVTALNSATSVAVDEDFTRDYSAVKYRISDPVDVEQSAMLNALVRCAERHLAKQRRMKEAGDAYKQALLLACEADSRSFAGRVCGEGDPPRQALRDMPIQF